jgi:hypothetical protein
MLSFWKSRSVRRLGAGDREFVSDNYEVILDSQASNTDIRALALLWWGIF